jgi:hypothetical protein
LRAEIATPDAKRRTAAVVWYTGSEIARFDFFEGEYSLKFDMKGADLSRLNGGPLTRNHSHDLADVVGVVEKSWIADGAGHATVRFSDRADVADLFADVRAGIITSVSMEAAILELEDATPQGDRKKAYVAKKWQPMALSLVPVGADANASIAALANQPTHPCVLTGANMEIEDPTTEETELEKLEDKAAKIAARRRARIEHLATSFGCGDVWCQKMIASEHSLDEITRLASVDRVKRSPYGPSGVGIGMDYDSPGARIAMMTEGLAARAMRKEPSEFGRRYADSTIVECAFECLSRYGHHQGLDVRRHGNRIVQQALAHTTSDFPLLLGNVLNKQLLPMYESAQATFRLIASPREFKDFRPARFLRAGDFPLPLALGEASEIKHGTMGENEELVSLLTFARIFGISRVALVNDDLGAFVTLAQSAATRVSDFHNATFFSTCITAAAGLGPTLLEGSVAVYNAAHGNLTTGGALDVAKIGSGRALMMNQTSIDGLKLNAAPKFLLVSPASLTLAEQLVATIAPAQASDANPFANKLTPIGDANLSGTRFYLLADPSRLAQYIYGSLAGEGPLRVEVRTDFATEGLQVKVVTDFGCGAIEYRAGVSGAGA